MAKDTPVTHCSCIDGEVRLIKCVRYSENGRFKHYKGSCPFCGARHTSETLIPEGHTRFDPLVPVISKRDRPQIIPADLHRLLEEEKRLRESNGEMDSESTEVDAQREHQSTE